MKDVNTCMFDYRGFCTLGDDCRKNHIGIICQDRSCRSKSSKKRNSSVCYYFFNYGNCIFEPSYRYLHGIFQRNTTVDVNIKSNTEEFKELDPKVKKLKNDIFLKESSDEGSR